MKTLKLHSMYIQCGYSFKNLNLTIYSKYLILNWATTSIWNWSIITWKRHGHGDRCNFFSYNLSLWMDRNVRPYLYHRLVSFSTFVRCRRHCHLCKLFAFSSSFQKPQFQPNFALSIIGLKGFKFVQIKKKMWVR